MEDNKGIFILAGILLLFSIIGFYKYFSSKPSIKSNYSNGSHTNNSYNNNYSDARKSAAKSSAYGYVDSIESYIGFYEAGINGLDGYNVEPPAPTITCVKNSGIWSGMGCQEFFDAVDAKNKGRIPDAAEVVIYNNKVQNNSKFIYGDYECIYSNLSMTCQ